MTFSDFGAGFIIFLWVVGIIVGIYWILFPIMVVRRLDKIIDLLKVQNRATFGLQPPTHTPGPPQSPGPAQHIVPCPTCGKSFGVVPGTSSVACPHCNAIANVV